MRLILTLFVLVFFVVNDSFGSTSKHGLHATSLNKTQPRAVLLAKADSLLNAGNIEVSTSIYEEIFKDSIPVPHTVLKKVALGYAAQHNSEKAITYAEKYLREEFKPEFLSYDGFENINQNEEFTAIVKKYTPKFTWVTFLYLYVALIGFYVTIVINLNKKIDLLARLLISSFIFIHSFFILHISLNLSNYQYQYPHTYLMSTTFSFLYGPLLYFYFKRISKRYNFRKRDLLHLLPTVLFLIYIIPIYSMSASDKLSLMLNRLNSGLQSQDSLFMALIVTAKLISLIVYGYFVGIIYRKSRVSTELSSKSRFWQKNVFIIHILYIVSYTIYGILISNNLNSGFFYHSQLIAMSVMVLYIGYTANVQPKVFSGLLSLPNPLAFKYKKSGLTRSLSKELKEKLVLLFEDAKIYKENSINLESIATKLDTTRHNASQVINEHFDMGFHELINKYRIEEAKKILHNDGQKNLNIIDVAYEVGYNNKVTFNKAFKKDTSLTPSQYLRCTVHA